MAYNVHDKFAKRAAREGLRARSAYKLLDIQRKYEVLKAGDTVLDLGCAQGRCLQVAAEIVGPKGGVVGIDIAATQHMEGANIFVWKEDILAPDLAQRVLAKAGKAFNAVLCDVAPNTTGMKNKDQQAAHELSLHALHIARGVLAHGGNVVIKVFEGPQTPEITKEAKAYFAHVVIVKPMASQKQSKEWYVVARGFKG